MTTKRERSERIAALNDELRKNPTHRALGLITMTSGVAALGPGFWVKVAEKLASLEPSDFEKGNDPYGERDFAPIEVDGEKLFFKIDYFEKGSEDGCGDARKSGDHRSCSHRDVTRGILT